jgi:hypothetical protein
MKISLLRCNFFPGAKPYVKAALVACLVLTAVLVGSAPVGAEPADSDPVQLHCLAVISSKARSACQDKDLIAKARNTASHHCTTEPLENNKKSNCIKNKAIDYIDAVDKKKPKDANDFKDKLDDVLKKAGGDSSKASDDSTKSISSGSCSEGSCIDPAADPNADCSKDRCDLIKKWVNPVINLLSLSFGVIAAASLIAGGVQYSTSMGDAQKVTNAKKRILNTLVAVVAYIFMYSFLQFLVPGGVFNR